MSVRRHMHSLFLLLGATSLSDFGLTARPTEKEGLDRVVSHDLSRSASEDTTALTLESKGAFQHLQHVASAPPSEQQEQLVPWWQDLRQPEDVERELRSHKRRLHSGEIVDKLQSSAKAVAAPVRVAESSAQEQSQAFDTKLPEAPRHRDDSNLEAPRHREETLAELLTPRQDTAKEEALRHRLDELENHALEEQTQRMREEDDMARGAEQEPSFLQVGEISHAMASSPNPTDAPDDFKDAKKVEYNGEECDVMESSNEGYPIKIYVPSEGQGRMMNEQEWKKAESLGDRGMKSSMFPADGSEKVETATLSQAFDVKNRAAQAPAEISDTLTDDQALGKSETWTAQFADSQKLRADTRTHYKGLLDQVAHDKHLEGKQQYDNFLAHVLAVRPKRVDGIIKKAKAVVDANDDVNKDSYEYVDDLERLANGTAVGYNRMGFDNFYGYDQMRAQLEEGHMAPGRAIRIIFPFGGNVEFVGGKGALTDRSRQYILNKFVEQVKAKIQKYRGMHFTICCHTSTNLKKTDEPKYYSDNPSVDFVIGEDGVKEGIRRMMNDRTQTLENIMKEVVQKTSLRSEEVSFPKLGADFGMHFDDPLFPAGAVILIAEDRLHHEDNHLTEKEVEHRNRVWQAQCQIDDFNPVRSYGRFDEYAVPMLEIGDLDREPESPFQENGSEDDLGRQSQKSFNAYMAANKGMDNVEELERAYNEGRREALQTEVASEEWDELRDRKSVV